MSSTQGLLILEVVEGSPAQKAGIEIGDVLLSYNGQVITDFKSFRKLLYSSRIGETVNLVVLHDGEEKSIEVVLE